MESLTKNSTESKSEYLFPNLIKIYGNTAANNIDINCIPLDIAIDELPNNIHRTVQSGRQEDAQLQFDADGLLEWAFQVLAPPSNLPNPLDAFAGLNQATKALAERIPKLAVLSNALEELRPAVALQFANKVRQARPLAGRKKLFYVYDCAQTLTASKSNPKDLDFLKSIFAAELITSWIQGKPARKGVIDRVMQQVRWLTKGQHEGANRPHGWSSRAQSKCLTQQVDSLVGACKKHPKTAHRIGLSVLQLEYLIAPPLEQILEFNRNYAHRMAACADYLSARDKQGAHAREGDIWFEVGSLIRQGIEALDKASLEVYFQTIFNCSQDLVSQIPINENLDESKAFLEVSIKRGLGKIDLHWLLSQGKKPTLLTEHLYEKSSRQYYVQFPPFVTAALQAHEAAMPHTSPDVLGDVLGEKHFHPRENIVGDDSAYRCTVNKFRNALIAVVLESGAPRMVAALSLSQFGLVSPGRPFYGMTRSFHLHKTIEKLYKKLGWLGSKEHLPTIEHSVGSMVVPTRESIKELFACLAKAVENADAEHAAANSITTWVTRHRAVVAYLSALLEFTLCLRNSAEYKINSFEIQPNVPSTHINDKKVRKLGGGAANGKPLLLIAVLEKYVAYLSCASAEPLLQQSAEGLHIHKSATGALDSNSGLTILVDFDLDGNSLEVGTSTWFKALPKPLRLVENFGRQFWPCEIQDAGLTQRHLDYLLRHVLEAWEHNTNQDPVPSSRVRRELMETINRVICAMDFTVPSLLRNMEVKE
jgi:hypothetical protein